jgi:hypothetical protein
MIHHVEMVSQKFYVPNFLTIDSGIQVIFRFRITRVLDIFHGVIFYKIENTIFRELDVFPPSSEG